MICWDDTFSNCVSASHKRSFCGTSCWQMEFFTLLCWQFCLFCRILPTEVCACEAQLGTDVMAETKPSCHTRMLSHTHMNFVVEVSRLQEASVGGDLGDAHPAAHAPSSEEVPFRDVLCQICFLHFFLLCMKWWVGSATGATLFYCGVTSPSSSACLGASAMFFLILECLKQSCPTCFSGLYLQISHQSRSLFWCLGHLHSLFFLVLCFFSRMWGGWR